MTDHPVTVKANNNGVHEVPSDAGHTWRNTMTRDQFIYDVTIDPRNPNILYACGFSSSAWRSADRGETWQRIRGFNFKWGHRVIPDPLDSAKIYITTYGGSVWQCKRSRPRCEHCPVSSDCLYFKRMQYGRSALI